MEREYERFEDELIDLGAVSVETRGNNGPPVEVGGLFIQAGISDE